MGWPNTHWTVDRDMERKLSNPPPVLTKQDFVRRYQLGEFGNASPTWNTLLDFGPIAKACDVPSMNAPRFHLRNRIKGGETHYNLLAEELVWLWLGKQMRGKEFDWYASEMAPHHINLIQGEVMQTEQGLYLYYSTAPNVPMRQALASNPQHAYGIMAIGLLRHYLCPNSYEWLQVLLDRYDGHVVEFSTFSKCWGTVPGYNSVIWEIRRY